MLVKNSVSVSLLSLPFIRSILCLVQHSSLPYQIAACTFWQAVLNYKQISKGVILHLLHGRHKAHHHGDDKHTTYNCGNKPLLFTVHHNITAPFLKGCHLHEIHFNLFCLFLYLLCLALL